MGWGGGTGIPRASARLVTERQLPVQDPTVMHYLCRRITELASPQQLHILARATTTRGVDEGYAAAILAGPSGCVGGRLRRQPGKEELGW
jgi:hypothetical protein